MDKGLIYALAFSGDSADGGGGGGESAEIAESVKFSPANDLARTVLPFDHFFSELKLGYVSGGGGVTINVTHGLSGSYTHSDDNHTLIYTGTGAPKAAEYFRKKRALFSWPPRTSGFSSPLVDWNIYLKVDDNIETPTWTIELTLESNVQQNTTFYGILTF